MLLLSAALTLAVLAVINHARSKCVLWPPTLHAGTWCVALLIVFLWRDRFDTISPLTVGIYLIGSLAFSAGAYLGTRNGALSTGQPLCDPISATNMRRVLMSAEVVCIGLLPLFVHRLLTLSGSVLADSVYAGLRAATIEIANTPGGGDFNVADNLPFFSLAVALIALNERARGLRAPLLVTSIVLTAFMYQVLTAERAGLFVLLLATLLVKYAHSHRLRLKPLLVAGGCFYAISVYNQLALQKGEDKSSLPTSEAVVMVSQELLAHAVSGVVAFDTVVRDPDAVPHNHTLLFFFVHSLNKLGANLDEPSRHSEFTTIGRGLQANVYTAYFCYYPNHGFVGLVLCMGLLGAMMGRLYDGMRAGEHTAAVLYSFGMPAIVMSVIADQFFMALNFWLKLWLISGAAYYLARHGPETHAGVGSEGPFVARGTAS